MFVHQITTTVLGMFSFRDSSFGTRGQKINYRRAFGRAWFTRNGRHSTPHLAFCRHLSANLYYTDYGPLYSTEHWPLKVLWGSKFQFGDIILKIQKLLQL